MIRDRIVVGLLNDGLSEIMQLDPNLTLERAVSMACQSEAVHKQQGIVRGTSHKVASWSLRIWRLGIPGGATKLSQLHKNTFHLEKQP